MYEKGESSCAIHDKIEPVTDSTYEVCFECGHVYESEEELLKEYNLDITSPLVVLPETKGTNIHHCPLCLHDFL